MDMGATNRRRPARLQFGGTRGDGANQQLVHERTGSAFFCKFFECGVTLARTTAGGVEGEGE
jgi:hypothetical protein